jgi:methylenetetrahydrofolate reductase (NADPH)
MSAAHQISFEFFPPRDAAGRSRLISNVASKLGELTPAYFSVTYGAGGTTKDGTRQTVENLIAAGFDAAPHLSMGADDEADIHALLDHYAASGVKRIVALRGDQPSGFGASRFAHNAEALVRLIRAHSGGHFDIEVAAYPEIHPDAEGAAFDLDYFKRKVDAGANGAITQYFYNVEAYFYYLDQCAAAGIDKPIYAGIMPITNYEALARFSRNCGAEIPRWICQRMESYGDDMDSVRKFGIEVVTQLCQTLMDSGAPGIHFYTMNQVEPTRAIYNNLGL